CGLDPFGPLLGNAFLPDHLAADALRLALELARPLVQRAHDPVPDGDEVVHEVELGLAARREVDLVRVRHLDGAAPELELDERRWHGRSIVNACSRTRARSASRLSRWTTSSSSSRPTRRPRLAAGSSSRRARRRSAGAGS